MIVIGLTGSIGMGKSTAAAMLRDMGIPVHDSDLAVHFLLAAGGKAVDKVGEKFPAALKTDDKGQTYIDRQALGKIVFADRARKKELEEILHPLVWEDSGRFIADMQAKGKEMVALDVPLLFETGGEKRVHVTVCVSAPPEVQKQRVLARPGMTSEKFERIVAGQMPDAEKRKRAHHVIDSGQSIDAMRAQLAAVVHKITPPA